MSIKKDKIKGLVIERTVGALDKTTDVLNNVEDKLVKSYGKRPPLQEIDLPFKLIMRPKRTTVGYKFVITNDEGVVEFTASKQTLMPVWEINDSSDKIIGYVRQDETPLGMRYYLINRGDEEGNLSSILIGIYKLSLGTTSVIINKKMFANSFVFIIDDTVLMRITRNAYPMGETITGKEKLYNRKMNATIEYLNLDDKEMAVIIAMALEYDRISTIKGMNKHYWGGE